MIMLSVSHKCSNNEKKFINNCSLNASDVCDDASVPSSQAFSFDLHKSPNKRIAASRISGAAFSKNGRMRMANDTYNT